MIKAKSLKKKIWAVLCGSFFYVLIIHFALADQDMVFMTEEYHPWNYVEKKELKGLSVDLLRKMWVKMGEADHDIQVLPWARGYAMVLRHPNHMLFTMARISQREHLFKWVGPISSTRYMLFGLKKNKIRLSSLWDAREYTIGTVRHDASEHLLSKKELLCLQPVHKIDLNIHMLYKGRIDLIIYDERSIFHVVESLNYDPDALESVWLLKTVDDYYAFHIDTPDTVIRKYQNALDGLKTEHEQILYRYLGHGL